MKSIVSRALLFACLLGLVSGAPARAEADGGDYPRLSVGAVAGAAPSRFGPGRGTGAFVSGNVGLRLSEWVQVDIADVSGFWSEQDLDDCPVESCGWDVDALFLGSALRVGYFRKPGDGNQIPNPFLIGGVGAGRLESNRDGPTEQNWNVAGNVGAGVEIPFGEHFTAGVTYRFFMMSDAFEGGRTQIHAIGFEFGWR